MVGPYFDMARSTSEGTDYIADAEQHNEWWSTDERLSDLEEVTSDAVTPRSDLLKFLEEVSEYRDDDVDNLAYSIYGSTGIGKTTLLLQAIAALLPHSTLDFSPGHRNPNIVGSIDPNQILYIPLEDSLYHLERPEEAIDQLGHVIDYYYSHIAPRGSRNYIFLDDIGALGLEEQEKTKLLELVEEDTYLIVTGIVESQVTLRDRSDDGEFEFELWPMLPMKFADTVQHGVYEDSALAELNPDFEQRIESLRTASIEDGDPLIDDVRDYLSDEETLDNAVKTLNQLYFDSFSESERDCLHDASREYLQRGGVFHRINDAEVKNELIRSHFLLYLYKELARYESIQRPENLHRISSLAATRAGEELRYTDISDQLEVDRRTVDTYLSVLDEGLSVTESHDYSLQRHRRTRLYLRNPRHAVLLSQRQEHHGLESYDQDRILNHEFEYTLARTVAFDHAKRLAFSVSYFDSGGPTVEYYDTEVGTVDYILHNDELVLPFVLSYQPYAGNGEEIASAFDPSVGKHSLGDGEDLRDLDYDSPYRFVITDSLPKGVTNAESLVVERDGVKICYLPFWLFLLVS
jgi:predicted AAA+ superfamily ATPase